MTFSLQMSMDLQPNSISPSYVVSHLRIPATTHVKQQIRIYENPPIIDTKTLRCDCDDGVDHISRKSATIWHLSIYYNFSLHCATFICDIDDVENEDRSNLCTWCRMKAEQTYQHAHFPRIVCLPRKPSGVVRPIIIQTPTLGLWFTVYFLLALFGR